MAIVSIRGLTKKFAEAAAVDDLDLEIGDGEFVSLLGPSGCGKTTTLRLLAGFLQPDGGRDPRRRRSRFIAVACSCRRSGATCR